MQLRETKPEARWRSNVRLLAPIVVLAATFIFTIGFFGFAHDVGTVRGTDTVYCTPDAHVRLAVVPSPVNNKWNHQRFLWITLGFGHFSFAAAKGVDLVWDLVIGRLGQLLIIYLTYPILRRALLRAMFQFPVYLPMYASITFDKISLSTVWAVLRGSAEDIPHHHPDHPETPVTLRIQAEAWLSRKWRYLAIVPLLAYILAFPTLLSVMTGYQADLEPYILRPDNQDYQSASSLQVPPIVILDGARVGLSNMTAGYGQESWFTDVSDYQKTLNHFNPQVLNAVNSATHAPGVQVGGSGPFVVGSPIDTNCYNGINYNSSTCSFEARISETDNPDCGLSDCSGALLIQPDITSKLTLSGKTWTLANPPLSIAIKGTYSGHYFYSIGSIALNTSYLSQTSRCQPSNTYLWGFSYLMLFTFCMLTMTFAAILSWVYLDTWRNSEADQFAQPASMYRDILDLAQEIKRIIGDNDEGLSTEELDRKIEKGRTGLQLEMDPLLLSRAEQKRIRQRKKAAGVVAQVEKASSAQVRKVSSPGRQRKGGLFLRDLLPMYFPVAKEDPL